MKRFALKDAAGKSHDYTVGTIDGDTACDLLERIVAAVGEAVKSSSAGGAPVLDALRRDRTLRVDLLRFAVRDGKPMASDVQRQEAYTDNPVEAFEAAYKVAEVSGFFARGGVSLTSLAKERAPAMLAVLAALGGSLTASSTPSDSTG